MKETSGKYLTVNAFRRDFFAAGSRPRRADVVGWIAREKARIKELETEYDVKLTADGDGQTNETTTGDEE